MTRAGMFTMLSIGFVAKIPRGGSRRMPSATVLSCHLTFGAALDGFGGAENANPTQDRV